MQTGSKLNTIVPRLVIDLVGISEEVKIINESKDLIWETGKVDKVALCVSYDKLLCLVCFLWKVIVSSVFLMTGYCA